MTLNTSGFPGYMTRLSLREIFDQTKAYLEINWTKAMNEDAQGNNPSSPEIVIALPCIVSEVGWGGGDIGRPYA